MCNGLVQRRPLVTTLSGGAQRSVSSASTSLQSFVENIARQMYTGKVTAERCQVHTLSVILAQTATAVLQTMARNESGLQHFARLIK